MRDAMLEVHVDACAEKRDNNETSRVNRWSHCGMDRYFCDKAKASQQLGKEPA